MEQIEYTGQWWFPGHEDEWVAGELVFDPHDGGTLEVQDSLLTQLDRFSDLDRRELPSVEDLPDRVYGVSRGGDLLTLETVYFSAYNDTSAADGTLTRSEDYHFRRLYSGVHLGSDRGFSDVSFTFPDLKEWFGESLIDRGLNLEYDELSEEGYQFVYGVKEPTSIDIELEGNRLSIFTGVRVSDGMESIELTEYTQISIRPEEDAEFTELNNEYLHPLRQYFAMALGKPVYPIDITGTLRQDVEEEHQPPQTVQIYQPYPHFQADLEIGVNDINFKLQNVDIEDSLKAWFDHFQNSQQFHKFYFGYRYNDSMYLEFQFLSLVVALESYYDQLMADPHMMESTEFDQLLEAVENAIPEDAEARTRILNLIESIGNYPSLSTQLEAVTNEYSGVIEPLIDLESLVYQATDIRHKIAHGYAQPPYDEILELLPLLSLTVETILYDVIGLPSNHIQQILVRNYDYVLNQD